MQAIFPLHRWHADIAAAGSWIATTAEQGAVLRLCVHPSSSSSKLIDALPEQIELHPKIHSHVASVLSMTTGGQTLVGAGLVTCDQRLSLAGGESKRMSRFAECVSRIGVANCIIEGRPVLHMSKGENGPTEVVGLCGDGPVLQWPADSSGTPLAPQLVCVRLKGNQRKITESAAGEASEVSQHGHVQCLQCNLDSFGDALTGHLGQSKACLCMLELPDGKREALLVLDQVDAFLGQGCRLVMQLQRSSDGIEQDAVQPGDIRDHAKGLLGLADESIDVPWIEAQLQRLGFSPHEELCLFANGKRERTFITIKE